MSHGVGLSNFPSMLRNERPATRAGGKTSKYMKSRVQRSGLIISRLFIDDSEIWTCSRVRNIPLPKSSVIRKRVIDSERFRPPT